MENYETRNTRERVNDSEARRNTRSLRLAKSILSERDQVEARIASVNERNAKLRKAGTPLTGPYWWLPIKSGGWHLFYVAEGKGFIPHMKAWPMAVDFLAKEFGRERTKLLRNIQNDLYGLPRGRVTKGLAGNYSGQYVVGHGNDNPPGTDLQSVVWTFNLPKNKTKIEFDAHEVMLPGSTANIERALGAEFGLPEAVGMEHEWDDDDYRDESETNDESLSIYLREMKKRMRSGD